MFGLRCDGCGEVRWSILGRPTRDDVECPACGQRMVQERRRPGREARARRVERRGVVVASSAPLRTTTGHTV